jgi:hypothetical protein
MVDEAGPHKEEEEGGRGVVESEEEEDYAAGSHTPIYVRRGFVLLLA